MAEKYRLLNLGTSCYIAAQPAPGCKTQNTAELSQPQVCHSDILALCQGHHGLQTQEYLANQQFHVIALSFTPPSSCHES